MTMGIWPIWTGNLGLPSAFDRATGLAHDQHDRDRPRKHDQDHHSGRAMSASPPNWRCEANNWMRSACEGIFTGRDRVQRVDFQAPLIRRARKRGTRRPLPASAAVCLRTVSLRYGLAGALRGLQRCGRRWFVGWKTSVCSHSQDKQTRSSKWGGGQEREGDA